MKHIFISAIIAFCLSLPAQGETIKLANGDWAPYMAANLKQHGVISHVVTEAFALEGITVEYTFLPWKRGFEDAKNGTLDGSAIWSKTPEREADFLFSDVVVDLETVLFIKKDSPFNWNSLEDLGKVSIGGVIGYSYGLEDLEASGKITITRIGTPENNYKKLVSGRLDTVAEDRDVGWELANTLGISDQVKAHPKPLKTKSYHLIISKNSAHAEKWLASFNRGLAKLKASGAFDKMLKDSQEGKYK